jgi:aminopeptidase N
MLRYVIGDSLFFKAMHDYATDPELKFRNAFTEDFIRIVNKATKEDLSWFFDQWVYGPNHPEYSNKYKIDSLGNDTWKVNLTINQTQKNAGFFKMPLQFMVKFQDGSETLLTVLNTENHQEFVFDLIKKPINLIFDPEQKILLKQVKN